jgi:hypothetical protein
MKTVLMDYYKVQGSFLRCERIEQSKKSLNV